MNKPKISGKGSIAAVLSTIAVFCFLILNARPAATKENVQTPSGAELFVQNCSRCHGETGQGGRGPNLTSPKRQAKWKNSDEKLIRQITNGGIFMPAFKKKLDTAQIQAIADHVRTLKP